MEKIITKLQGRCHKIQESTPKISYDQGINTIGAAGSFAGGFYAYKSHKIKESHKKVTVYQYAQQLREEVANGKLRIEQAELMLRDIGINEQYLKFLASDKTAILPSTHDSASFKANTSRFATLSNSFYSKPQRNKKISYVEISATPPSNFMVKESPGKACLAGLLSVIIYFSFMKIIKSFVKAMTKFAGKKPASK